MVLLVWFLFCLGFGSLSLGHLCGYTAVVAEDEQKLVVTLEEMEIVLSIR